MTAMPLPQQKTTGLVGGRVALVTGGTRGIGAAICHRLAAEGASIAAGYWRHREGAEKFQAAMSAEFPEQLCTLHEGNIGLADDCRRVVRDVIDQHGRVDILVNNAGITIDRTAAKMSDDDWQRVASKSGLFGLTKSLAREAIFQLNRAGRPVGDGLGLTVNAVTPGFVATDMMATIPDRVLARIREQIPVGRLGRPEEIARVVGFLAADESAYITGQIWAVNGGLDM
jgi:NAD(P)-dependent dehydrogenase (short-subunit alcohol dehydrogenase family)